MQTHGDIAEKVDGDAEKALGRAVRMCPWRALSDPFVVHVMRASSWAKKGELSTRWGGDPPEALLRGIEVFDAAVSRVEAHDIRADREEREREQAKAKPGPAPRR